MKKYKLVNGNGYSHFIKGKTYNEDVVLGSREVSVKQLVEEYPNDWEEVTDKLVGNIFTDAEVVTLITFLNDNFEDFKNCINLKPPYGIGWANYDLLEGDLSKYKANLLIDKLEKNNTPLTEAEKVTLITFLNARFEDFKNFINNQTYEEGGLSIFYVMLLCGERNERASLLIDKIELS